MLPENIFLHEKCFHTKQLTQLQLESTSKGNQRKWYNHKEGIYVKEQFRYQNKMWKDYLVEVLSYEIWQQFKHDKNVNVLRQQKCKIVDYDCTSMGVYSSNFCEQNEYFVSFKRLLELNGKSFPVSGTISEKWDFTLDTMNYITSLDLVDYLITMSILDYLVGNEDRHLNNFGVITTGKNFKLAPLFDFGLGLFEHDRKYEGEPLRRCIEMMQCQPFSKNNQEVIDFLGKRYDLEKYLPGTLDFTYSEIPTPKAGSYIRNRCMKLCITVKGLD